MADDRWTGIGLADTRESPARRGIALDNDDRSDNGWQRLLRGELSARSRVTAPTSVEMARSMMRRGHKTASLARRAPRFAAGTWPGVAMNRTIGLLAVARPTDTVAQR